MLHSPGNDGGGNHRNKYSGKRDSGEWQEILLAGNRQPGWIPAVSFTPRVREANSITTTPVSSSLLKGAIIGLNPMNPLAIVIVFQYNPEIMSRRLEALRLVPHDLYPNVELQVKRQRQGDW